MQYNLTLLRSDPFSAKNEKLSPIKNDVVFLIQKFLIAQEKNTSMLMCSVFVSSKGFLYHKAPWPAWSHSLRGMVCWGIALLN